MLPARASKWKTWWHNHQFPLTPPRYVARHLGAATRDGLAELVIIGHNNRAGHGDAWREAKEPWPVGGVEHRGFRTFSVDQLSTSKGTIVGYKSAYSDGLVASRDNTVKRAAVARLGYAEDEHKRRAAVSTQHRKQAIASLYVPECGARRISEGARAWCAWCVENGC